MHGFLYEAPPSLDAALALVAGAPPGEVGLLAGGTDLLVQIRGGARRPRAVVDLKKIPELRSITLDATGLRLGAAVSCFELSQRDDVRGAYPGLMEAAELIGSMQIQGRASVGGNLCNASPAADTVPALIALRAEAVVAAPGGERRIPVEDFVVAPGRSALAAGELLVALHVPPPRPRSAGAYLRFIPRAEMDIAVVGAGVWVSLDDRGVCTDARVALGAVAARPLLVPAAAEALIGTSLDAAAVAAAGEAARAAADPITDKRGTAEYRRKLAAVLTRRATQAAHLRAEARA